MSPDDPTRITKELNTDICYGILNFSIKAEECALNYCLDASSKNCVLLNSNYINRIGRTI